MKCPDCGNEMEKRDWYQEHWCYNCGKSFAFDSIVIKSKLKGE